MFLSPPLSDHGGGIISPEDEMKILPVICPISHLYYLQIFFFIFNSDKIVMSISYNKRGIFPFAVEIIILILSSDRIFMLCPC